MEGTDLSIFDEVGDKDRRNQEDEDTLDQLEWELASQSGRLTGIVFYPKQTQVQCFTLSSLAGSVVYPIHSGARKIKIH